MGVIGARSKDLLLFENELKAFVNELLISTDDGSYGHKGLVTELLRDRLEKDKAVFEVVAVGPVPMEMDWLDGQEDFTRASCASFDFDYLLGSVHFIGNWGFDDGAEPWKAFSQEECEKNYQAYFEAWERMINSGLFNIAAHPDLIKIFSVEQFHIWLAKPESAALVRRGLNALLHAGMSMEISSAGIRKACREIYPAPPIMVMAASMGLPISFASDAHATEDVGYGFARLASYARAFGFSEYTIFDRGRKIILPL